MYQLIIFSSGPIFIGLCEEIKSSKLKLAEKSKSDHMTLLRAFQGWQMAKVDDTAETYCASLNLSHEALEHINNIRTILLGHLRASGFVRAKGKKTSESLARRASHGLDFAVLLFLLKEPLVKVMLF
jgi:HrpA-like RNA helicase